MHIKTIKGKKYYYESKRIGKKVVSKYVGPADKIDRKSPDESDEYESEGEDFYTG